MNSIQHPCKNQCPNFIEEQCCHCLITNDTSDQKNIDESKYLKLAFEAQGEIS